MEFGCPVERAASRGGRTSLVHPIHPIRTNERVQTLRSLLNSLIKRLRRRMTTFPQNLILSKEHALNTTHKTTPFTIQIRVDFLLKGRLIEISGADGDTESDRLFLGFARDVLEDGKGGVDASAFFKEGADGAAGTFGGDKDYVDVGGGDDTGEILVHDGEPVGEVQSLH